MTPDTVDRDDLADRVRALSATMRLVIIESPYAGDVEANTTYARCCLRDSLRRGEAPIASHLLYTQPGVLDDLVPEERAIGIAAGLMWGDLATATVVYVDRGISRGMACGIERARMHGRVVEYRSVEAYPTAATIALLAGLFVKQGVPSSAAPAHVCTCAQPTEAYGTLAEPCPGCRELAAAGAP